MQVVTKHPLEANLTGHSLERLPKYYFLNYNLVAMNLAHNFMIVSPVCQVYFVGIFECVRTVMGFCLEAS